MMMIFGASGFLGAAMVNKLSKKHFVLAVVRPQSDISRIGLNKNVEILRKPEHEWATLVISFKPEIVICAQWQGVGKLDRENQDIQWSNVIAIEAIAKKALESNCMRFVALGSQAESAESHLLVPEEYIASGETFYGKAKSELVQRLFSIFDDTTTQLTWVRVFSVYGPMEHRDSIFSQLGQALIDDKTFHIEEPTKKWSFLFQDDFARGMELILERMGGADIINLANPQLIEIQELPRFVGLTKISKNESIKQASAGFFPIITKLRKLGWENRVSIEIGCKLTVDSMLQD